MEGPEFVTWNENTGQIEITPTELSQVGVWNITLQRTIGNAEPQFFPFTVTVNDPCISPKIRGPPELSVKYFFNGTKTVPVGEFKVEPSLCPLTYRMQESACRIVTFEN